MIRLEVGDDNDEDVDDDEDDDHGDDDDHDDVDDYKWRATNFTLS